MRTEEAPIPLPFQNSHLEATPTTVDLYTTFEQIAGRMTGQFGYVPAGEWRLSGEKSHAVRKIPVAEGTATIHGFAKHYGNAGRGVQRIIFGDVEVDSHATQANYPSHLTYHFRTDPDGYVDISEEVGGERKAVVLADQMGPLADLLLMLQQEILSKQ